MFCTPWGERGREGGGLLRGNQKGAQAGPRPSAVTGLGPPRPAAPYNLAPRSEPLRPRPQVTGKPRRRFNLEYRREHKPPACRPRVYVKGPQGIVSLFFVSAFQKTTAAQQPGSEALRWGSGAARPGGGGRPAPQPAATRRLTRPGAHRHFSARSLPEQRSPVRRLGSPSRPGSAVNSPPRRSRDWARLRGSRRGGGAAAGGRPVPPRRSPLLTQLGARVSPRHGPRCRRLSGPAGGAGRLRPPRSRPARPGKGGGGRARQVSPGPRGTAFPRRRRLSTEPTAPELPVRRQPRPYPHPSAGLLRREPPGHCSPSGKQRRACRLDDHEARHLRISSG